MASYRLTNKADEDLASLYLYGLTNFGLVQADFYYESIMRRFDEIADQPLRFQKSEYRKGYRRSVHFPHTIYYRIIDADMVEIVRILRSQDPREEL